MAKAVEPTRASGRPIHEAPTRDQPSRSTGDRGWAAGVSVQISLDVSTIDEALHLAEIAARAGVDWLEAGTGLLFLQGIEAIRALRNLTRDYARLKPIDQIGLLADNWSLGLAGYESPALALDMIAAIPASGRPDCTRICPRRAWSSAA